MMDKETWEWVTSAIGAILLLVSFMSFALGWSIGVQIGFAVIFAGWFVGIVLARSIDDLHDLIERGFRE